jgi:glycerol-3-phosphate acyltransferase PlsY
MYLLSAAIGYLIGCISFGYITGKILKNRDIRDVGSGNAGTANVIRNFGWVPGLITFAGDVFKGVAASLIGLLIAGWPGACIGGLMAVVGHILPFYLKFKGGKGVATSFGVFLVIMPWQALIVFTFCIILIAVTKTMSVGSLAGTAVMAGLSWIFFLTRWWLPIDNIWVPIASTLLFVLVFYSHRANIKRLAEGKENQL